MPEPAPEGSLSGTRLAVLTYGAVSGAVGLYHGLWNLVGEIAPVEFSQYNSGDGTSSSRIVYGQTILVLGGLHLLLAFTAASSWLRTARGRRALARALGLVSGLAFGGAAALGGAITMLVGGLPIPPGNTFGITTRPPGPAGVLALVLGSIVVIGLLVGARGGLRSQSGSALVWMVPLLLLTGAAAAFAATPGVARTCSYYSYGEYLQCIPKSRAVARDAVLYCGPGIVALAGFAWDRVRYGSTVPAARETSATNEREVDGA